MRRPGNRQRVVLDYGISRSTYQCLLFVFASFLLVALFTVIFLSITLSAGSGAGAGGGRFLTPAPPVTFSTGTTGTLPPTTTITTTVTTTTTTTPVTTTPMPDPIVITCPPDITLVYGKDYDEGTVANAFGRGPGSFVNATGGCDPGGPTITRTDTTVSGIAKKTEPLPFFAPLKHTEEQKEHMFGQLYTSNYHGWETIQKQKRSLSPKTPSYPGNTLFGSTSMFTTTNTGASFPDPTMAVGPNHIVWAVNQEPDGTLIRITGVDDVSSVLSSFTLSSLASVNSNCTQGLATDRASVLYDQYLGVWVLMERSATLLNDTCFYVSDSSNPITSSWTQYQVNLPGGANGVTYPQLALWGQYYTLTFDALPKTSPHCFVDKTTFDVVCFDQGYANLNGFTERQLWTPVDMDGSPMPPSLIEDLSTGSGGGVFVRPRDDELHDGQNTPGFDVIEIVHYSKLNFTLQTVMRLRYFVSVLDFDSVVGEAVQPSGPPLQRLGDLLMPRAMFRWLPECDNKGSLVVAYTTADGIRWAELNFGILPGILDRFALVHQGRLLGTNLFLPSIGITSNGTIALVYANGTSSFLTTRAVDDVTNMMRIPKVLDMSTGNSPIAAWGRAQSMATSPVVGDNGHRTFYVASVFGDAVNPWNVNGHRIRVLGEVVERTFTATDSCGQSESCTEIIRLE